MKRKTAETLVNPLLTTETHDPPPPGAKCNSPTQTRDQTNETPVVNAPGGPVMQVSHKLHTCSGGSGRKSYYRYQVWQGHKVLHSKHIPGGNVDNPIALARAERVRKWIRNGVNPSPILRQIEDWKRKDKKARPSQLPLL